MSLTQGRCVFWKMLLFFRLWITETGEEMCSWPTQLQSYMDICKLPFIWWPPGAVAHGRHQTLSWRHVSSLRENDTPAVTGFLLLPEAVSTGLVFPPQSRKTNFLRNKPGKKMGHTEGKTKQKREKKNCDVNKWHKCSPRARRQCIAAWWSLVQGAQSRSSEGLSPYWRCLDGSQGDFIKKIGVLAVRTGSGPPDI